MILPFRQRKPRGYHHRPIYSDERKERLQAMEAKARKDLHMAEPTEIKPEDFRHTFSATSQRRRDRNAASLLGTMPTAIMILLIGALLLLMIYLMNS